MNYLEDFPPEFSKHFEIGFAFLSKANISIHDRNRGFGTKLRTLLLVFCYVTFYASLTVSFGKVFAGELGFYELANLLPIFMVATQGAMKGTVIISNLAKARRVVNELGALWRTTGLTKKQLTKKTMMLKRLKLFNAAFYWMNIVGTWQYILVPLFETLFRTVVLGQDKLLFPFICTFPFDATRNWLVYLATYFYESYSMLHLIYMYLGVEFLMITLCSHLATEFELLREELLHSKPTLDETDSTLQDNGFRQSMDTDSLDYEEITEYFEVTDVSDDRADGDGPGIKDVIRRHQKLIRLAELLDDIFNKMIFFNLLFATITICFFGFVAKIARDPAEMANNFVGVVASMIPIYNLCFYAELLSGASLVIKIEPKLFTAHDSVMESASSMGIGISTKFPQAMYQCIFKIQSAGVADSAYHNLWYEGNNIQYQKTIIFIIVRSQNACSLTSMRYSPVTLNTFTTVLSTTWSYFSLAISVFEPDKYN